MDAVRIYGLENYISNIGYVPHNEVLEYQKKTQLLLLIEENSKQTEYIIPGKLFEYMASKRPIIAIGPQDANASCSKVFKKFGRFFLGGSTTHAFQNFI